MMPFACADSDPYPAPETLPYRIEWVRDIELKSDNPHMRVIHADLTGDNRDEFLTIVKSDLSTDGLGSVIIKTSDHQYKDQVNFSGHISTYEAMPYGYENDTGLIVSYERSDSLFIRYLNHEGKTLFHFFIVSGEPRVEKDESYPWDISAQYHIRDITGDGREELISILNTGYAAKPRGIMIHSIPDGKLLNSFFIGAQPRDAFIEDFDRDGIMELLLTTSSPDNGANAGGFTDKQPYFILFELPSLKIEMQKMYPLEGGTVLAEYLDLDGDYTKKIVIRISPKREEVYGDRIEIVDPATLKVTYQITIDDVLKIYEPANIISDGKMEFIGSTPDKIIIMNNKMETIRWMPLPNRAASISILQDIDRDNISEILHTDPFGSMLFDENLEIKAYWPTGVIQSVIQRGVDPPHLFGRTDTHYVELRMTPNFWYPVYHYGPIVAWTALAAGLLIALTVGVTKQRESVFMRTLGRQGLDLSETGLLAIDLQGRIKYMNPAFRRWFEVKGLKSGSARSVEAVLKHVDRLADFIQAHQNMEEDKVTTFTYRFHDKEHNYQVTASRVKTDRGDGVGALFRFEPSPYPGPEMKDEAWALMAQQIAHDIKNPLAGLLLTLRELQTDYRTHSPEMTERYDQHVEGITNRIEQLRRLSRNFMKFTGQEAPHLTEVDLNQVAADTVRDIGEGLPSDLTVRFEPGEDMPIISVDREQIESVLENLVANAVNAMPDGGLITVTASMARRLQQTPDDAPKDYIVLEVQDTGSGILDENRDQIFDPGFTTSDYGAGLGLTLVKMTVSDHGGFMEITGEEGRGTIVSIYLPVRQDDE